MSLTGLKSFPAPHCPPPKAQAPCLDLLPLWTPPFTTWSSMSCLQPPGALLPRVFALVASGETASPCSLFCPVNPFVSFKTQLSSHALTHQPTRAPSVPGTQSLAWEPEERGGMRKGKRQEKPSSFPNPSACGVCYLPTRFTKGPGCSFTAF